jgi:hypothetical protein
MTPYNPKRGHMEFNEQAQPAFDQLEPMDFDDKADTEERENQDLIRTQINQDKKNRVKL